ncbi:hypothetical protein ACXR2T_10290 [Leucobacter sp. HY1910]
MQHPFSVESPNRGRLNDLVSRVVEATARMRALQAELRGASLRAQSQDPQHLNHTQLPRIFDGKS